MPAKLKIERIREYFESEGCILLSKEYVSKAGYLEYICNEGHRTRTTWHWFYTKGRRCKHCAHIAQGLKQRTLTDEERAERIRNKIARKNKSELKRRIAILNKIELHRQYFNDKGFTFIRIKDGYVYYECFDKKHGIHKQKIRSERGYGCKKCIARTKKDDAIIEFEEAGYTILQDVPAIVDIREKMLCQCLHGHKQYKGLNKIRAQRGRGCHKCNDIQNTQITRGRLIDYFRDSEWMPISDFMRQESIDKIQIKCKHDHITTISPRYLLEYDPPCRICYPRFRGEAKIEKYLKDKGIVFKSQWTDHACYNEKKLRFDFFLPEYNTIIEFNGQQHYKQVDHFGGVNGYDKIKKSDAIKRKYAYDHGIRLLVISYDEEKNISNILDEALYGMGGSGKRVTLSDG